MPLRALAPLVLLLLAQAASAAPLPDTILLSPEVMARTKQRYLERDPAVMPAVQELLREADRCVTAPAEAVVLKPAPPPGGDMHDYWSLAPYWWPDPNRLGGLPYVRRDGRRNPDADGDKFDRRRMNRMSRDALTLALAWYLTGNDQYAGKGCALVWSWCCDRLTRTNPNLKYGQSRPGVAEGTSAGIIETRDLIRVAEAGRILNPSPLWSDVETRKLAEWFKEYAHWLLTSDLGREAAAAANNQGTWYDAQLAVFALYAGDKSLARSIVNTVEIRRILPQIKPDGTMPEELKRTRSRHYTFFNLEAFFVLAEAGERLGIDLWRAGGPGTGSIKAALDAAAPFIDPQTAWPHGETGRFDPFLFTPLFHRAALVYKDDRYLDHLKALPEEGRRTDRALLFY
ncbi:alginate lyase family protein [Pseudodesulfovibrio sp.]|uniref:alginate lyase family protein n=1 Tax=Pseudodesulfovibrio sp. TaxID=2035812 RepID=UPI0026074C58|nr:alginate lyase family protein [Pseudodesulfovibrio sp.]MDD3313739.1 alginate lyase family protein [Pseudodesulfovibrio sp.]